MESIPSGPLILILGHYCDSPMTSLALACCSQACRASLEDSWHGLHKAWSIRWGDSWLVGERDGLRDQGSQRRTSKRLTDRDYYTPHKKFVRLVETGAVNAAHCHSEIFHLVCERKLLSLTKLRELLNTWTPVWVNCGGFKRENGQAPLLVEALRSRAMVSRHARAVTEELILRWGADKEATYGDGMRPLSVAAARGFSDCVDFLIKIGCSLRSISKGTFTVKKKYIKGEFTPHEWAKIMYKAEVDAGTSEVILRGLKKCIDLTRVE